MSRRRPRSGLSERPAAAPARMFITRCGSADNRMIPKNSWRSPACSLGRPASSLRRQLDQQETTADHQLGAEDPESPAQFYRRAARCGGDDADRAQPNRDPEQLLGLVRPQHADLAYWTRQRLRKDLKSIPQGAAIVSRWTLLYCTLWPPRSDTMCRPKRG